MTQPESHQALIEGLFRQYDTIALGAFRDIRAEAKADGTAVTEVDRAASRLLLDTLKAHTPEWGVISEEEPEPWRPDAPWQWVIDPLDGTASFSRGYPVWGLGIGLMEGDTPRQGYLRFPALDETYVFAGDGLRFNGRPVTPSPPETLKDTRNYLLDSSLHKRFRTFAPLGDIKLRIFGSNLYHMVCVAMGRAEAMICGRVYLWDLAAALPMTRARGMTERYVDGSPFDLGAVRRAHPPRVKAPLVLGPPERVDEIVAALSAVL